MKTEKGKGKGIKMVSAKSELEPLPRAQADTMAVSTDLPMVPQPADAEHIREITSAVRSWSAGE